MLKSGGNQRQYKKYFRTYRFFKHSKLILIPKTIFIMKLYNGIFDFKNIKQINIAINIKNQIITIKSLNE